MKTILESECCTPVQFFLVLSGKIDRKNKFFGKLTTVEI